MGFSIRQTWGHLSTEMFHGKKNPSGIASRYAKEVFQLSCHWVNQELDWLQSLKQFFINMSYHILVARLTLMALFWAVRVRLATSIWYDTLIKNCFKDWSRSNQERQSHDRRNKYSRLEAGIQPKKFDLSYKMTLHFLDNFWMIKS